MKRITNAVEQILQRGYAVFPMPDTLRQSFMSVPEALSRIDDEMKIEFSFPSKLDGFLPFGQEHAENNPDHPDLCERFCYFQKFRHERARHPMASTTFYQAIEAYERDMALLSEQMLAALFGRLGAQPPASPGEDSYIQLCRYGAEYTAMGQDRDYLMDPHIDGQLLTFIAQTEQGLMVGEPGELSRVAFSSSELFVMAGTLLELATDGEIKGILHAVGRHGGDTGRLSLMYFHNPCFAAPPYPSLRSGTPIDFFAVANEIHKSYGNPSYKHATDAKAMLEPA